jgi:uncharacterized protein (TIGR03067 family)
MKFNFVLLSLRVNINMRLILFIALLAVSIGCSNSKKIKATANELNGIWIPVQQEFGGKALPASLYEKQTLTIDNNKYSLVAESVDKGEVIYSNGKMDIYGKEGVNAGKHFMAIYKYENEQLAVCYNLSGDSYPVAFETKTKPMLFLSVFKKS